MRMVSSQGNPSQGKQMCLQVPDRVFHKNQVNKPLIFLDTYAFYDIVGFLTILVNKEVCVELEATEGLLKIMC